MLRAAIIGIHLSRREMTGGERGQNKSRWNFCMEMVRSVTETKLCCVVLNNCSEESRLGLVDPMEELTETQFCCVVFNKFWEESRLGRIDPLLRRHCLHRRREIMRCNLERVKVSY
ncbi:RNI-like superfamily protein [Striga asiatica]|uniref:RNI-like superfamily protein n=1 Tax=Striga asiatica TaxID=4170 RepID=A0A5A7QIA2_STRAF|nr:RNI-like superfamily protein [Striga asiatica]